MPNVTSIEHYPGATTGVHFTGSGIPVDVFNPTFLAPSSGATLDVHAYDLHGRFMWNETYTPTTTATGAYGLARTGSTFLADLQSQGPIQSTVTKGVSYGYEAFARGGIVEVGRGGLPIAGTSGLYCNPGAPLPYALGPDDCLRWCLLAGSDGWDIVSANRVEASSTSLNLAGLTGTTAAIVAGLTGWRIQVTALNHKEAGTASVTYQSHTTTALALGPYSEVAQTGIVLNYNPDGWLTCAAGEGLDVVFNSGAGALGGSLNWRYVK
jgi:hypothetical protein